MEKVPEDVMMQQILLKLPANSLVNLRYVSNYLWSLITDPSFVKLHLHHSIAQPTNHFLLISSHQLVPKLYQNGILSILTSVHVNHNYACSFTTTSSSSAAAISQLEEEISEIHCPFESTEIRASCNGLLYLHRRKRINPGTEIEEVDILNYIWNPCTKEYKELPPPPLPVLELGFENHNDLPNTGWRYSSSCGFCGFGYDSTNDEYKILHYENRVDPTTFLRAGIFIEVTNVSSTIEFKLYTLGTNTWTSIVDNPYKSFFFSEPYKRIGLLVNGALHWIMCLSDPASKGKIVSFDIEKEAFREVQKPHYNNNYKYSESVQVLRECLCWCQIHSRNKEIDLWILQDYNVMDSWTKLFRVVIPTTESFCLENFRLLRYCENGEIVMLRNGKDVIVYNPINHKARHAKKFNESIAKSRMYYVDYTESLVSLNSDNNAVPGVPNMRFWGEIMRESFNRCLPQ